jgi:hypothetical protein
LNAASTSVGSLTNYGIVDREWLAIVANALAVRAALPDVPQTKVHSLAHWASDTHSLYINCYDGSMIRMRIREEDKRAVSTERVPVAGSLQIHPKFRETSPATQLPKGVKCQLSNHGWNVGRTIPKRWFIL